MRHRQSLRSPFPPFAISSVRHSLRSPSPLLTSSPYPSANNPLHTQEGCGSTSHRPCPAATTPTPTVIIKLRSHPNAKMEMIGWRTNQQPANPRAPPLTQHPPATLPATNNPSSCLSHQINHVPHLNSRRSLRFNPIARDVKESDAPLRTGCFADRSGSKREMDTVPVMTHSTLCIPLLLLPPPVTSSASSAPPLIYHPLDPSSHPIIQVQSPPTTPCPRSATDYNTQGLSAKREGDAT